MTYKTPCDDSDSDEDKDYLVYGHGDIWIDERGTKYKFRFFEDFKDPQQRALVILRYFYQRLIKAWTDDKPFLPDCNPDVMDIQDILNLAVNEH